jgi:CBS domain-containing protein
METIEPTRAEDLMRTHLISLSPDDTIVAAIAQLEESRISGAPVVDENGKLAGVLSLSDIARTDHLAGDRVAAERGDFEMSEPSGEERTDEVDPNDVFFLKEDYSAELLGRELVGDWMTRDVISVSPEATLEEVCQVMVSEHIHRVFVTEAEKLVGVISSFDVVRKIARARTRRVR